MEPEILLFCYKSPPLDHYILSQTNSVYVLARIYLHPT
jgi:hypothetical protein